MAALDLSTVPIIKRSLHVPPLEEIKDGNSHKN